MTFIINPSSQIFTNKNLYPLQDKVATVPIHTPHNRKKSNPSRAALLIIVIFIMPLSVHGAYTKSFSGSTTNV